MPISWPSPFTIICDTREQLPWNFSGMKKRVGKRYKPIEQETVRETLKTGDYSIRGRETEIVIERKSIDDLVNTLTRGRARFIRELERLQEFKWSAIVIEGGWESIKIECDLWRKTSHESIEGSILAMMQRYPGTHWILRQSRQIAEKTAWKALHRFFLDNNNNNTTEKGDKNDC